MTWICTFPAKHAKHYESGDSFELTYGRNIQSIEDIGLRPAPSSTQNWSSEDLSRLKNELWEHILEGQRRESLSRNIELAFAGKRSVAADVISQLTSHKVSARSVQAWLSEPHKQGSRRCPEWAVKALEEHVKSLPNSARRTPVTQQIQDSRFWSADMLDKECVSKAHERIEADERRRLKWETASVAKMIDFIVAFERETQQRLSALERKLATIRTSLRTSSTVEELKDSILTQLDERDNYEWEVGQTRKAIETRSDEFGNEEGTLL